MHIYYIIPNCLLGRLPFSYLGGLCPAYLVDRIAPKGRVLIRIVRNTYFQ